MKQTLTKSINNLYPQKLSLEFNSLTLNLDVPEGVWNPTAHGKLLAHSLLNCDFKGEHVLEIGAGCGIHTILIGLKAADKITATEINSSILNNTRHNYEKHDLKVPIEYVIADWVQVPSGPFDCVVSNPPFWMAKKKNRRYFIDTLILEAHKLIKAGGRLIFVQSSMADKFLSIEMMKSWGMDVRILMESSGPFRDYYYEDKEYMKEIEKVPEAYTMLDGVHYEKLFVFEARLPN